MKNERIEFLRPAEYKLLTQLTAGYGSVTDAAIETGLHHQTIRSIRKLGYGKPASISIIRKKLLSRNKTKALA